MLREITWSFKLFNVILLCDVLSFTFHHSSPTYSSNPTQPPFLFHSDQCIIVHPSTVLHDGCHRMSPEAWSHNAYCRAYWTFRQSSIQQSSTSSNKHESFTTSTVISLAAGDPSMKVKLPCKQKKVNMRDGVEMDEEMMETKSYGVSSVWCYSSPESGLQCTFENLLYNLEQQEFVFVFGPPSIIYGIDRIQSLQDKLFLSSIEGHNAFAFHITILDNGVADNIRRRYIMGRSIIMSRVKPNNIHHVFHDDLIPLYFTMREMCGNHHDCMLYTSIFLTDLNPKGNYWDLYQTLSEDIMIASELKGWLMFESARIGLNKLSVWYQYGFDKIQGPAVKPGFSGYHLQEFTLHIMHKLSIRKSILEPSTEYGILISRKTNRKILNEDEIVEAIQEQLSDHARGKDAEVSVMSLEENSIKEFIVAVSQARAMVGVHGSALTLAMFLPPGSVLIELWPYGINPDAVQVYRTMCELRDFGVIYVPWMNKDKVNSVYHPEYPAHYGGISHLPVQEQDHLLQSLHGKRVEKLACCDNSEWLMKIYQDTLVYIHDIAPYYNSVPFTTIMEYALKKSDQYLAEHKSSHHLLIDLYPSKVQELSCSLEKEGDHARLRMRWKDPWNVGHLHCKKLWFEVMWKTGKNTQPVTEYTSDRGFFKQLSDSIEVVDTWVTCYCNGNEGSVMYAKCSIN